MTKRLTLRRDTLVELVPADLEAIAAAARSPFVLNCALGDVDANHSAAQCLAGCTCYCG